jgi:hypothetical protein
VSRSIAAESAVAPAEQTSNRYATPEQENFLNEINAAGTEPAGTAAAAGEFCRGEIAERQELPAGAALGPWRRKRLTAPTGSN